MGLSRNTILIVDDMASNRLFLKNVLGDEYEYLEAGNGKIALELNRRVALCDLVSHEFVDGNTRKRRSVFSDGTTVTADFDADTFEIVYPDGAVVRG